MEKIEFTEGFVYKSFKYGWLKDTLYRLPIKKDNRQYSMREVPQINITDTILGYRIQRDRKSVTQVAAMTKNVSYKVKAIHCLTCK